MTLILSPKFTPEVLISAPRRSAAAPNASGTHAIYTISTYDLEAHKESKEIRILRIDDVSSNLFSTDVADKDPQWLGETDHVLYLRSTEGGETELWIANGIGEKGAYFAGKICSEVNDVKTAQLKNGNVAITFTAPMNKKGKLLNTKSADKPKHTGREYVSHPVRVWDTWNPADYRFSLFFTTISKQANGRWKLRKDPPRNALKGSDLRFPRSAGGVLGESGTYAVGPRGILLCTADPEQNLAIRLLFRPYFIRLETFEETNPKIMLLTNDEYVGGVDSPTFSPDGSVAAYAVGKHKVMQTSTKGIAIFHLDDDSATKTTGSLSTVLFKFEDDDKPTWDRFAGGLEFSPDNKAIYIATEDRGYPSLFQLDISKPSKKAVSAPRQLTKQSSVSAAPVLDRKKSGSKILLTTSSFSEPSLYSILDTANGKITPISSISNNGADYGLHSKQYESIDYPGDKTERQAFIIRPSHFDPKKKYPVLLLVHGGPQSAWNNSWSTRWNPAIWAEAGYICLLPNPTGSTGFGLKCMADICRDWGGSCYRDIERLVDYAEKHIPYADLNNMSLAGASFGGYMAYWIAGQPLAKRLKSIVSHDGVFHNSSMLASDYIADLDKEVGSFLWDDVKPWEKWSPANYVKNWDRPMLVIHSENDYRCPINEGLAPYGVCQAKGIESRFLYFSDENHWVQKRENSLKWQNVVLGWFNRYSGLKGVQLEPTLDDPNFEDEDDSEDEKDE